MREVVIAGIGQIPVGEHWELSLRNISARAVQAAKKDAGGLIPEAIYIGNLIASVASHQSNLGALVTDNTFLEGTESYTIEAGEASSAAAFRMAYLAVASGWVDIAMALGMEKYTDLSGDTMDEPTKLVMDYDYEVYTGQTLTSQAGMLMQRYLYENPKADRMAFGAFPLIGHINAVNNPNAMFRKAIRPEVYEKAGMVSSPMNMFDIAPYADGAGKHRQARASQQEIAGHPIEPAQDTCNALLLRPFNYDTLATRVMEKASLENLGDAAPAALLVTLVGLAAVALMARANR